MKRFRRFKTWFSRKPENVLAMRLPGSVPPDQIDDIKAFLLERITSGDRRGIRDLCRLYMRRYNRIASKERSIDAPITEDGLTILDLTSSEDGVVIKDYNRKRRKRGKISIKKCANCHDAFEITSSKTTFCGHDCQVDFYRKQRTKLDVASVVNDAKTCSIAEIGRKYEVSGTAVSAFARRHGIKIIGIGHCYCGKPKMSRTAKYCALHKRLSSAKTHRDYLRRKRGTPDSRFVVMDPTSSGRRTTPVFVPLRGCQ